MSENSKYSKEYGNFLVELTGSLLSVKESGETIHAKLVSPISAAEKFNHACTKVQEYVLKKGS